ncbi:glycosyltransferase family 8 protein [Candidatus Avelusimicrobium faecicola]|uniref:glycosyltransferase family 8 protein n=1 Tax=Candidatus Avelusimicrobium faecicola TaxID=3416205 RepID=UPI003CBC89D0|nr:glycosyltransferase family 8 protein [Spirochaetota bacterium]
MKTVYIIYSCNEAYVPYTYISILSLLENKKVGESYHIYILHSGLSAANRQYLNLLQQDSVSISLIDMTGTLKQFPPDLFRVNLHFTAETYYRFFLPELFPQLDKVLYIDSDTLICKDIGTLFTVELGNAYLAVTRDLEIVRVAHCDLCPVQRHYFQKILNLANLDDYFQAGVMVVNLVQWRKENLTAKLLACLRKVKTPLYVDQDILNSICQGNVKFIPQNWDYTWHLPFVDYHYTRHLPEPYLSQYLAAHKEPYIIHFTGEKMKPENLPSEPESRLFWRYAAQSPYFEQLRERMQREQIKQFQFVQKNRWKLLRYWLLTKIAFGNFRQRYVTKYNNLRKKIERFLNQEVQI